METDGRRIWQLFADHYYLFAGTPTGGHAGMLVRCGITTKRSSTDFGTDKGADIPVTTEYPRNLHALLNAHGNDLRLTTGCVHPG